MPEWITALLNADPSAWSVFIVIIALIISVRKQLWATINKVVTHRLTSDADNRDAAQDLQQAQFESAAQQRATDSALSARTIEEAFSIVREVLGFAQKEFSDLASQVEDQGRHLNRNTRELIDIKNKLQMIVMILDRLDQDREK